MLIAIQHSAITSRFEWYARGLVALYGFHTGLRACLSEPRFKLFARLCRRNVPVLSSPLQRSLFEAVGSGNGRFAVVHGIFEATL